MDPIAITVTFYLTHVTLPKPVLVGVANYNVRVTPARIPGLLADIRKVIDDLAYRYEITFDTTLEGHVLSCVTPLIEKELDKPLDQYVTPPELLTLVDKPINYCINACLKNVHLQCYHLE